MSEKDLELDEIRGIIYNNVSGKEVDSRQCGKLAQAILTYIRQEEVKLLEEVLKEVNKEVNIGWTAHDFQDVLNKYFQQEIDRIKGE